MSRLRRIGFVGLAVLALGLPIFGASAQIPILEDIEFPPLQFELPKADVVTLSNGVRLYLLEDHELPVFDLVVYIRTGDVYDPPDKIGLAGLTAKVLRTGGTETRTPDDLNETLEYIAGSLESGMDVENAVVRLSVMSKDIDLGIELLADVLRNPAFREEKLELARAQALEGIRRQNDNPGQIAARFLYQKVFGTHPYGYWPTEETLTSITREDLFEFHRQYYRPGAMSIAASGDFDRAALIERLEAAFAGLDAPAEEIAPIAPPTPNEGGIYHAEKELNQSTIYMAHLGLRRTNPDWFAVRLMNDILGGSGFTSRMMREVRTNRGLAYAVGTGFQRRNEPGLFYAYCMTRAEATVRAIQAMKEIIEGIRSEPVSDAELDLVKNAAINSFIFGFTSSAQVAEQDLRIDFFGYPKDYLETYTEKLAAVTKEDILRVAREYLHPDKLTIVTVGQREQFDPPLETLGPVTELSLDE